MGGNLFFIFSHMLSSKQKNILLFSDILFSLALALLFGAAYILFWNFSWLVFFLSFICGIALFSGGYKQRFLYPFVIFFLSFPFFLWFFSLKTDFSSLDTLVGKSFSQEVVISGESVKEKTTQRVPFVFSYCQNEQCFEAEANLRTQWWEVYQWGDHVRFSCTWELPEYNEETQTDWKRIFASRGPVLFCFDYGAKKTGQRTLSWGARLSDARIGWETRLEKILPYPENALGSGLLFGGSSRLSEEWEQKLNATSMTHIVAVSGYNVTLLVQYLSLFAILLGIRRQYSWLIAGFGIVLFIALIGFPASGVRAAIMGALALFAVCGGTVNSGLRALFVASACMVFVNPFILRYDVGFQLSVLATAGILIGMPFCISFFRIHKLSFLRRTIAEMALTTLCAQMFVFPIILHSFGTFSFLSFFANMAILWNIPLIMFFLFIALLVSFFSFFVAEIVSLGAFFLLFFNLSLIEVFSSLSYVATLPPLSNVVLILYSVILIGIFSWYYAKNRREKQVQCKRYAMDEV